MPALSWVLQTQLCREYTDPTTRSCIIVKEGETVQLNPFLMQLKPAFAGFPPFLLHKGILLQRPPGLAGAFLPPLPCFPLVPGLTPLQPCTSGPHLRTASESPATAPIQETSHSQLPCVSARCCLSSPRKLFPGICWLLFHILLRKTSLTAHRQEPHCSSLPGGLSSLSSHSGFSF